MTLCSCKQISESRSRASGANSRGYGYQNSRTLSAMATIAASIFSLSSLRTTPQAHSSSTFLPCPNFTPSNSTLKFPRWGISHKKRKASKQMFPVVISCLVEDNSEAYQEPEGSSDSNEPTPGATIDLKLPRRSLLVHFTCNACGERSQKLINRLAYEKGTVFVQCTGCSKYHKLVDNLNLVVEYDFREEINTSPDTDQV